MFAKAQFAKASHAPSTAGFSSALRLLLANRAQINRYTGKIEHLVSHRKQRTGHQINRHTFGYPAARKNRRSRNSFASSASFASYASFSPRLDFLIATRPAYLFAPPEGFTDHGSRATSHKSTTEGQIAQFPGMKLDCVSNGHARATICVRIAELARIVGVSGVLPGAVCHEKA
jgi:hypothetical protein